jgi:hypothetical protein
MDALKRLPVCPAPTSAPSEAPTGAKIVEIEDEDRDELHISIRECTKAVWGNLGAVYVVMVSVATGCTRTDHAGRPQGDSRGVHQR